MNATVDTKTLGYARFTQKLSRPSLDTWTIETYGRKFFKFFFFFFM